MKRANSCKVWFAQLDRLRGELLPDKTKERKLRTTPRRDIFKEDSAKHRSGDAAGPSKVKRNF
jgi:hypothetical protein